MSLEEVAKEILDYNEDRFPGWEWQKVDATRDWTVEDIEILLNTLMNIYYTACIAGEAGELVNKTKKYLRSVLGWTGSQMPYDEYWLEAFDEMGDIFIYWLLYCKVMGFNPAQVAKAALEKNKKRFDNEGTKEEELES